MYASVIPMKNSAIVSHERATTALGPVFASGGYSVSELVGSE